MFVVAEALCSLPQPKRCGRALLCVVTAALLAAPAAPARGQAAAAPAYDSLPSDPKLALDSKEWKDLQRIKNQILAGSLSFAENRAQFDGWYKGYMLPSFTNVNELHKLAANRDELRRDLRATSRMPEVRTALLDLTYKYMVGIATTPKYNFHPASRINAMLLLGELNQNEGPPQQKYPDPLPRALDGVLLPQFNNAAQSDFVRGAALIGILRHAQYDCARPDAQRVPIATRQAAVQAMMTLIEAKDPPPNRDAKIHAWMQRRAIETVAALGAVGPRPEVNKAIERIMLDPNADIVLRCTAGAALKQVNVSSQQKQPALDPANLSLKLGALAVNAVHNELDRIDKELEKTPDPGSSSYMAGMAGSGGYGGESGYGGTGSSMGMGMPGMSMGMGGPSGMGMGSSGMGMGMPGMESGMSGETGSSESGYMGGYGGMSGMGGYGMSSMAPGEDAKVDLSRRRFKGFIVSVQNGLDGMKKLATADPAKSTVKEVGDRLNEILKATDPPEAPKKPAPAAAAGSGMPPGMMPGYGMESGGTGPMGSTGAAKTKLTLRQLSKAVSEALLPLEQLTRGVAPPPPVAAAAPVSDVPDAVPATPPATPDAAPGPAPAPQPDAASAGPATPATPGDTATPPAVSPSPPASAPATAPNPGTPAATP